MLLFKQNFYFLQDVLFFIQRTDVLCEGGRANTMIVLSPMNLKLFKKILESASAMSINSPSLVIQISFGQLSKSL